MDHDTLNPTMPDATWAWGDGVDDDERDPIHDDNDNDSPPPTPPPPQPEEPLPNMRHHGPRTCRICLDTVNPTFHTTSTIPGASLFTNNPTTRQRVSYLSDDSELGRLISPCKCKGSQKYVHEGCLNAWRKAAPMSDRNFWRCPTCQYEYRLERLTWGRWLKSSVVRGSLTAGILLVTVFVLGFVADPIINLWLDPVGTISETVAEVLDDVEALKPTFGGGGGGGDEEDESWAYHFLKGVYSLGLLGAVKSVFAMSPWHWWNFRAGGVLGGRRQRANDGRDRLENVSMALVLLGVVTFIGTVWKGVSLLSARVLEKASERVMDVGGDEPDDDNTETRRNQ